MVETSAKVKLPKVREAIVALKKFVAKKNEAENRLFDANSEPIMLQFTLRDIPAKRKHKPVLIKLANSLSNPISWTHALSFWTC